MRFATATVAVLVCSVTLAAAQTTINDPTVAPPKPAVTKTPPPPASVNVLNFPETQAVAGTVSVDNLPAVQSVGGTVNVGNLPLDADGAVRVTTACPSSTPLQTHYVNLLPNGPISVPDSDGFVSAVADARGYSRIGIDAAGDLVKVFIEWTWSNLPEFFAPVTDTRNGSMQNTCIDAFLQYADGTQARRFVCVVSGEQVRLRVRGYQSSAPLSALGVYLIP
jgi:hypothetical protein